MRVNPFVVESYSFSGDDFRILDAPGAEEKTEVPCAALTTAERTQKRGEQKGPFKNASPLGAQDILAPTKRAFP
jgi:hypothetical protein